LWRHEQIWSARQHTDQFSITGLSGGQGWFRICKLR